MEKVKLFSIIFVVILALNMILFAMKRINMIAFWVIIAISALFAYKFLPKLKK